MGMGFAFSTVLAADAPTLWAHATSIKGINRELSPLRMSAPADLRGPDGLDRLLPRVPGQGLFVSWVTLLGVIPLDRHVFGLDRIVPNEGFWERSRTALMRDWRHVRTLEPVVGGTRLTDQVWFESRVPGLDRLLAGLYRGVFRKRHAVLRRLFGAVEAPTDQPSGP